MGAQELHRIGDLVRVRRQRWTVSDLRTYERCALLTLAGTGASNAGTAMQVLTPFEEVQHVATRPRVQRVSGRHWRHACRAVVADAGDSGCLRTARTARVDLLPFQLAPALSVVRGLASRVLIADDVGLGKTIQACLIVTELMARGAATRVLVLAPSGLRDQWKHELESRFDVATVIMDMAEAKRLQARLPPGANPWLPEPVVVTSIDYVKRSEVVAAVVSCPWDVVIVDEAHGIGKGTDRHHAVAELCARAAYVVLLTATPHNGDDLAFDALRAIGEAGDPLMTFRRTRRETGLGRGRRVHQLRLRGSDAERRMHGSLAAFVRAVRRDRGEADPSVLLALGILQKRAYSGAHALKLSVERRLTALADPEAARIQQLLLPLEDPSGEMDAADNTPPWTAPALDDAHEERDLLLRIAAAAHAAVGTESKLAALARLLRRLREPAIVFTEYRDTLLHVRDTVAPDAAIIHGGLTRDERRTALDRFSRGGVLLATDAAGEGLNLHATCRVVINLELPWNPMRLEQRLGRVDRIGQTRTVHAIHLIAAGLGETTMLDRLQARVTRAQDALGIANPLHSGPLDWPTPLEPVSPCSDVAAAEHERLRLARRVAGTERRRPSDEATLLTRSRRSAVRAHLGSRGLVLAVSALTDHVGRTVALHITPVLARLPDAAACSRAHLDAISEAAVDPWLQEWIDRSLRIHAAFWTRRLDRAISVADRANTAPVRAFQPGLFDGRVPRAAAAADEIAAERSADADACLASIRRALPLALTTRVPALVLLP